MIYKCISIETEAITPSGSTTVAGDIVILNMLWFIISYKRIILGLNLREIKECTGTDVAHKVKF